MPILSDPNPPSLAQILAVVLGAIVTAIALIVPLSIWMFP